MNDAFDTLHEALLRLWDAMAGNWRYLLMVFITTVGVAMLLAWMGFI